MYDYLYLYVYLYVYAITDIHLPFNCVHTDLEVRQQMKNTFPATDRAKQGREIRRATNSGFSFCSGRQKKG